MTGWTRLFPATLAACLVLPITLTAQSQPRPDSAILAVLNQQMKDWNAGNLDAFATGYKNSSGILFIGSTIRHGYAEMLAGYRKSYPNREKMGTLNFSALVVQPLDVHFATVTGHFHLDRTAAAGGAANGYFLLVVEKTPSGWKIVRDDTTALPAIAAK